MRAFVLFALLLSSSAQAGETITYSYDALGRLTKVARAGTVNNGANACYTYDPASNRTNVTSAPSANCTPGGGGMALRQQPWNRLESVTVESVTVHLISGIDGFGFGDRIPGFQDSVTSRIR